MNKLSTQFLRPLTPTEAATFYSLVITGVIGGLGTLALAQSIKNKQEVPISTLTNWTILLGIVTAISVISITKASR